MNKVYVISCNDYPQYFSYDEAKTQQFVCSKNNSEKDKDYFRFWHYKEVDEI
jgi:transcription initiation factor IIE alpha subunit